MNTEDFISYVRDKVRTNLLSCNSRYDDCEKDHLIKAIRAIITTNKEIWERCRESMIIHPPNRSKKTKKKDLYFKSVTYSSINVSTNYSELYDSTHSLLNFETAAKLRIKKFGMPASIPSELTNILSYKEQKGELLPDYDHFLETSLLLCDDVLIPFLSHLKTHLEEIQVFLGRIESWLMESAGCINFIKEVFKKPLKTKAISEDDAICRNCCEVLKYHDFRECGTRYSFYLSPDSKIVLKSCKAKGKHEDTFNLMEEKDREKLKIFLKFVS